jgi:hypothetical protein
MMPTAGERKIDPLSHRFRTDLLRPRAVRAHLHRVVVALERCGAHPRAGRRAGRDLVAQPYLGGHRSERAGRIRTGETSLEQDLRVAPGDLQVFVRRRHVVKEADIERRVERRVDVPDGGREGEVRVGFHQALHDLGPGAVHYLVARLGLGAAAGPHALDAVAADDDVSGHGRRTGPVKDLPAGEQNPVLGHL